MTTPAVPLDGDSNLRPTRSRKDRPCDYCRQLKHSCHIVTRGQPCVNCTKTGRECTFAEPPRKRKRDQGSMSSTGGLEQSDPSRPSSSQAQAAAGQEVFLHPHSGSAGESSSRTSSFQSTPGQPQTSTSRRSSTKTSRRESGAGPSSSALSRFLDSLDEEDTLQQSIEDSIDYPSLDAENNDQEESHYLGSRAFAHLVLSYPQPGATVSSNALGSSEKLHYRQVADPKNPAYFLRNPSRIYGLSNHAFIAEKAYQMVYDFLRDVDPEYPHKMVQVFLKESLPAMPILNRARLQAACFNPQTPTPFPYTVLTGILTHAAAHFVDLRPKIRELWKVVLSLEENEYRQPRLQTLQLTLLDIWGRPCSSPGHNHAALCRAIGAAQLLGLHRNCDRWKLPKWERSVRKRIWWTLYVFDKWNAFVYGRPSNITTHAVPIPTTRDADPGESLDVFIASCRLACILDSLLPVLGSDTPVEVDHRMLVRDAAKQMGDLARDTSLRNQEPGSCSYRLDYLGVQVLICRIGLDETRVLSAKQLDKVAQNVLAIAEGVADFLDSLTPDDYVSFWAPWSSYQISHTASLILQTCLKLHQLGPGTGTTHASPTQTTLDALFQLLKRLILTCQSQALGGHEIAEAAIPKIRRLVQSIPELNHATLAEIREMMAPPAKAATETQLDPMTAEFPFDFATLLNSAEWLAPGLEWINANGAIPTPSPAPATSQATLPVPTPLPLPTSLAGHGHAQAQHQAQLQAQMVLPPLMAAAPSAMLGGDDGLPPMPASAPGGTTTRLWF